MGHAGNKEQAYRNYVGPTGIAHVPTIKMSVKETLDQAKNEQGVSCLAHPWYLRDRTTRERLKKTTFEPVLANFVNMGLQGLECSAHTKEGLDYYDSMARNFGLVRVFGSDFHHSWKGKQIGSTDIKQRDLDNLFQAMADRSRT
jgi:predicted metal-dependent phosphoesterase TrpH